MKWKQRTVDSSLQLALSSLRNDVLDVSLENPLINYKESASRGVYKLATTPQTLLSHLVFKRNEVVLTHDHSRTMRTSSPSISIPQLGSDFGEDAAVETYASQPETVLVPTSETEADLDRRLLATYYSSKASLEEDDTVTLYIALGLLRWRESDDRDAAYSSPLLLIPVQLERASASGGFRLFYTGDDVLHNACLYELMKRSGVALPEVPLLEKLNLSSYFEAVQKAIAAKPFWYADVESVSLGFFDCSRMIIHQDLDSVNWPNSSLVEHDVLKPLLGTASFAKPPVGVGHEASLDDRLAGSQLVQVLEADSSQLQAMIEISNGGSVVIQGPPGTGKSQTIVNIIANAIATQKTILFVSDKLAALDVVKRRLEEVGLGETVLEFHSHRTRKRTVFQQLRRTLDLRATSMAVNMEQVAVEQAALETFQGRLNEYCLAVNRGSDATGESPYSLYSPLMNLGKRFEKMILPNLELPEAISWTPTDVQSRRQKLEQIEAALVSCGVPSQHPFWGASPIVMTPTTREKLRQALLQAESALAVINQNRAIVASHLGVSPPSTWQGIELFEQVCARLQDAPTLTGLNHHLPTWQLNRLQLEEVLQSGAELSALQQRWSAVITPSAWNSDVSRLRELASNIKGKWWKSTARELSSLQDSISYLVLGVQSRGLEDLVAIVDAIGKSQTLARRIESSTSVMLEIFGAHWRGQASDWRELRLQFEWINELSNHLPASELPSWIIPLTEGKIDRSKLAKIVNIIDSQRTSYRANRALVNQVLEIGAEFKDLAVLRNAGDDLELLQSGFSFLIQHVQDLGSLTRYLQVRAESCELLGEPVIEVAETWSEAPKHLLSLFEYKRLSVLLEKMFSTDPFLATFDSTQHSKIVQDFRLFDRKSLQWSRSVTASKHLDSIRNASASKPKFEAIGAMSGCIPTPSSIRKLITQYSDAVQIVKPVFMMSPQSVAALLPPESIHFDLVIFDEASQLRPIDALGSIARGRQAVVVGDNKQLPPTRQTATNGATDSILDLFCSRSAPQHILRWHYRSQHESLIALSNHLFYDNQIIVFPSPDRRRLGVGLVANHIALEDSVDADTGRETEAKAIAHAVMNYATQQMRLSASERNSLGVATLHIRQRDRILQHIEQMKSLRPELADFFSESQNEPFFVKNLENIQGDERDIIFISIGYGHPSETSFTQALGPLLRQEGERRLNVLFTRARRRCEVFTTIRSVDISISDKSSSGLAAFKTFLNYAEYGRINRLLPLDQTPDATFEVQLAETIEKFGYTVQRKVGMAGFTIDLAIVDPREPDRFVMGILCDGPSYKEARSTRDRDRLREQVLTNIGWTLYRVWSTAWFLDRKDEEQKLATSLAFATQLLDKSEYISFAEAESELQSGQSAQNITTS